LFANARLVYSTPVDVRRARRSAWS
jgi:hypothetical protein